MCRAEIQEFQVNFRMCDIYDIWIFVHLKWAKKKHCENGV